MGGIGSSLKSSQRRHSRHIAPVVPRGGQLSLPFTQDVKNPACSPYPAKVSSYGVSLLGSSIRLRCIRIIPSPLNAAASRLKAAILAEFQGRCPTFQEMFSIPPKKWLTVPRICETLLRELEAIMGIYQDQMRSPAFPRMSDAELLARLERLQWDLERLRHDIQTRTGNVPRKQPSSDKSDHH